MKERCDEMDIVRRSDLVLERLHNLYGYNLGNSLYSTWAQLVQFGEGRTKNTMSKPLITDTKTAYRSRLFLVLFNAAASAIFNSSEDFSFKDNTYVDDNVSEIVIEKASVA